jgi:hypothetical protein
MTYPIPAAAHPTTLSKGPSYKEAFVEYCINFSIKAPQFSINDLFMQISPRSPDGASCRKYIYPPDITHKIGMRARLNAKGTASAVIYSSDLLLDKLRMIPMLPIKREKIV